jgi:hypothetical protein
MKISGRPLFWFMIVMVLFLFWRAPQQMSAVLSGLGYAFVALGEEIAKFLAELTHKPLSGFSSAQSLVFDWPARG